MSCGAGGTPSPVGWFGRHLTLSFALWAKKEPNWVLESLLLRQQLQVALCCHQLHRISSRDRLLWPVVRRLTETCDPTATGPAGDRSALAPQGGPCCYCDDS